MRTTSFRSNLGTRSSPMQVILSRNAALAKAFSGMKSPYTLRRRTGMNNFRVPLFSMGQWYMHVIYQK